MEDIAADGAAADSADSLDNEAALVGANQLAVRQAAADQNVGGDMISPNAAKVAVGGATSSHTLQDEPSAFGPVESAPVAESGRGPFIEEGQPSSAPFESPCKTSGQVESYATPEGSVAAEQRPLAAEQASVAAEHASVASVASVAAQPPQPPLEAAGDAALHLVDAHENGSGSSQNSPFRPYATRHSPHIKYHRMYLFIGTRSCPDDCAVDHLHLPRKLVLSASEAQRCDGITLGRGAANSLQLDSLRLPGMVSRMHCRFRCDAATRVWTVEDLGGKNMTAINCERLVPTEASPTHSFFLPFFPHMSHPISPFVTAMILFRCRQPPRALRNGDLLCIGRWRGAYRSEVCYRVVFGST